MIEETVRKAHFWMPHNWDSLQKSSYAMRMVSKFMEGETRDGWQITAEPLVIKPRVLSPEAANFWTPDEGDKAFTITTEHPWYDPTRDLYLVQAPARREGLLTQLEVPDYVIENMVKQNGLKDGEFLPGWQV